MDEKVNEIFDEATLAVPGNCIYARRVVKKENILNILVYIFTELQYMQRTYPGCEW